MKAVFSNSIDRYRSVIRSVAFAGLLSFSSSAGMAESIVASADEAGNVVRVGLPVLTMYGLDPADAALAMDRIFQLAWAGTTGFKSEVFKSDAEFYQAIADGEIDLAPMLIEEYLNRPLGCNVDPVLQGVTADTGGGTELILLAREDFDLESLGGQKLLMDSVQQLAVPWLDLVLAEEGLPENVEHFGIIGNRPQSKDVVLQTFFGQADACVTSKQAFDILAELNPNLRSRLKVLAQSEPMAMHVICVASNFDEQRRETLLKSLMELHQKPAGKQLLLLTKMNRIDVCDSALVEAASNLKQRWDALREKRKKEWLNKQKENVAMKPVLAADEQREEAQ